MEPRQGFVGFSFVRCWLPPCELLCLAKISYTCKMNDLAQRSIRTFQLNLLL